MKKSSINAKWILYVASIIIAYALLLNFTSNSTMMDVITVVYLLIFIFATYKYTTKFLRGELKIKEHPIMFGTLVIFLAPVLLFWALIGVIFGVYKN
jgi:hypothetical protein